MGLEEVIHDILDKAKSESAAALRQANEKADEIIKKANADILIKEQKAGEDLQRVKDSSERKEMAEAALLSKKEFQNVKKELIEQAYSGLNEKISEMPDKIREYFLKALIERGLSEISDAGRIYVNKQDIKIAGAIIKSGKVSMLAADILGGAIVESSDTKFCVDYSFERLVERIRETRTKELSEILFSGAKEPAGKPAKKSKKK